MGQLERVNFQFNTAGPCDFHRTGWPFYSRKKTQDMSENKVLKTLRFTPSMLAQLAELAAARGVTVTELVLESCRRTLVEAGYEVAERVHRRRRGCPAPGKPKRPRGRPRKAACGASVGKM